MLISFDWLREFVPFEGEAQELGDRLTMLGLELDSIEDPFEKVKDIVVGHVVECGRHPEAEKLSVCKVDVGDEVLDIVCGAPNVGQGQKVPVAKVGTVMPGGLKIKKAKLRGLPSHGMICSERELEFSDNHDGIWVLPEDLKPGEKLVDALKLERTVLDFDITPNRADCLSHLGFAREAALAFDLPLTMPKLALTESGGDAAGEIKVVIDDPALCPLYSARIIRDVQQKASPEWMRMRLLAVGQRPISNIVDVTNYIMFELGQPLHAFDMDRIEKATIRVAPAEDGMKFTTLDEVERTLTPADLLIWDGVKPVALAGVMGGLNSEMTGDSRNVLLESAVFRPGTIRKTARRLALPSDASYRFERGVDQVLNRFCLDRAAQLMSEIAGGSVVSGVAVNEPTPWQDRVHGYRHDRCMRLLGLDLEPGFAKKVFTLEGCQVDDSDPDNWKVSSPSHRLDLEREVDLYEEVGRVYGLDRIPAVLPRVKKNMDGEVTSDTPYGFIRRIKLWGAGAGLSEAVNYSFVGTDDLDRLNMAPEGRVIIANPLSEEQNVMRTDLTPGLLNTLKHNLAQGNNHVRVFEVAKRFVADAESETETREHTRLGILLYGSRHAQEWPWPHADADYLDIKGHVEHLLSDSLKLEEAEFALVADHAYLEPCVSVSVYGKPVGFMGMVRPEMADYYHARKDVWVADLDVEMLRDLTREHSIQFANLPVFPPSRRDVTVIGSMTLQAGAVVAAIRDMNIKILESVELVAEYIPEGQEEERNLSFRLTYRHPAKTLKDKEVDKQHKRVLNELSSKLPVRF
ncbi:phenylalanine--tRNA ligase subunit beta [Pseudodesulfovibrio tunisiensis]|uniref:phenylalanine--tRNA ligase subunit beta n=1 Tax=Pseudodesulfovibrio tunisiensis TaxID=463192 RepID=UPI001FB4CFAA|nr:phenylalanine--tRNA ligase subunit beta [Pseudodesulfovibrio tunisiensis]